MRDFEELEHLRIRGPEVTALWGWDGDGTCGVFAVRSPIDRQPMKVVATTGLAWDHVSVSREKRCPNWPEMEAVKRLFFKEDEVAMQLHVPASDHVNMHATCLHLWRPQDAEIPRPPSIMVGVGDRPARDLEDALQIIKEAEL